MKLKEKYFIVTNPANGWDCVYSTLYKGYTENEVREILNKERGDDTEDKLIIHELYLLNEKIN